jgi:hypothetical protein
MRRVRVSVVGATAHVFNGKTATGSRLAHPTHSTRMMVRYFTFSPAMGDLGSSFVILTMANDAICYVKAALPAEVCPTFQILDRIETLFMRHIDES